MPLDATLGLSALVALYLLGPFALGYLGWVQRRRHAASALVLAAVAVALGVAGVALTLAPPDTGLSRAVQMPMVAGLGLATGLAVGWKLRLRRRAGFRVGETTAERLLPLLVFADLLLLLLAWPALAEWRAGLG